jgi:hypothetical protein
MVELSSAGSGPEFVEATAPSGAARQIKHMVFKLFDAAAPAALVATLPL